MKRANKPSVDTFIKVYILGGMKNATQAAIDAGYSEKTADQQASRLLKNVKVKTAIKEHQEKVTNSFIWNKEKKLKILQDIMECATKKDPEKGMINMPSAVAAMKEHNLMQGDNAPVEQEITHNVNETLAERLKRGSKR